MEPSPIPPVPIGIQLSIGKLLMVAWLGFCLGNILGYLIWPPT